MAGPLFLSENFWNTQMFPGHTITSSEDLDNYEDWKVGVGRRSITNYWSPFTPNTAHWNQAQCDRIRGANCCFIDRNSNLAGYEVILQTSYDGLSPWAAAFDVTLPTASVTNSLSDTSYGVRTEEGAWGILFPQYSGLYWRLYVPAMGVGLLPNVGGLYVGMAYQPLNGFLLPWGEDQTVQTMETMRTPYGWRGRGARGDAHSGQISFKLLLDEEYDLARTHLQGYYGSGAPTWVCYDQAQGDRSFLISRPDGPLGVSFLPNWFPRQVSFSYLEHDPLAA